MIMIIILIAYITCLVTNDAWHTYGVIGVYKIHYGADRVSCFHVSRSRQYCGWLVRSWARSGPVTFNEASKIVVG